MFPKEVMMFAEFGNYAQTGWKLGGTRVKRRMASTRLGPAIAVSGSLQQKFKDWLPSCTVARTLRRSNRNQHESRLAFWSRVLMYCSLYMIDPSVMRSRKLSGRAAEAPKPRFERILDNPMWL